MSDWRRNREPRVDEAILSDDEEATPDVDPALVARLETWFGPLGVSADQPDESPRIPGHIWSPPDNPHQEWRRARALEAAGRGELWPRIEARGQSYGKMIAPLPPMELGIDPGIARLDLEVWPVRPADGPSELMRPEDLSEELREQVPQAVLRDLHRPEPEVGPIELERVSLVEETGVRPLETVRAIIDTRYRIDICALLDTPAQIRAATAEMRQRIDGTPWADARPEKPSAFPSSNPADLMKWFGEES